MRTRLPFALIATAFAYSLFTAPAQAQRARTFVASYGDDSNPCTFLSPCRTFQQAVNVVAVGGEVTAIDSAGFGTVAINKSVTITSPPGIEASIATSANQAAVSINASSTDVITLRGLTLNGAGAGSYGVNFTVGAKLAVIDCFITNYAQYGILVNVAANTSVLISNTTVSETPGGVVLQTTGNGTISATLEHNAFDNDTDGVELLASGQEISATISNSVFGTNSSLGIYAIGNSQGHSKVVARDLTFSKMPFAIILDGDTAIWLSDVTSVVGSIQCSATNTNNSIMSDGSNRVGATSSCSIQPWLQL